MTETQIKTKGWPPKRRAEYAERIRKNRIWRFSTGPRTKEGKARSCQNAVSHGAYTAEWQIVRLALLAQRQHLHRLKQWVKVLNIQPAPVDHIHIRYADHLAPDIFFGNTANTDEYTGASCSNWTRCVFAVTAVVQFFFRCAFGMTTKLIYSPTHKSFARMPR